LHCPPLRPAHARFARHTRRDEYPHAAARVHLATGLAPYAWLVGERIERAKELLETTHLKAQDVAARVGMGSAESLRHHFRQRVGTTPAQYRRRFWRAAGQ